MAAGKLGDEKQELPEHKLAINKNRGGLWKVTAEVFEIFCIAQQIFKKHVETSSNEIDGHLMTNNTRGHSWASKFFKVKVQYKSRWEWDHKKYSGRL